ncbi:MAG: hypothetical protein H6736_05070 [Alphaproteobacteria bacterium]|nr:hypothetical protein [Alphaproteobacteria bacterium]
MQPKTVVVLNPLEGTSRLHPTPVLAARRPSSADLPETFLPVPEVVEAAVLESVAGRLAVAP